MWFDLPDFRLNKPAIVLGLILLVFASCVWTFWPKPKPVVGQSVQLPPAKEVRTVEKVILKPKYIYVYPDKSKNGLNLPKSLSEDPQKKLIATGKLDAEDRPYTMSAILDETGNASIYARPDPLPWLAPGKRGGARLTQWHNGVTELDVSHDLLQIKSLYAGVTGKLDTRGDNLAGVYVEYRF